MSTVEKEKKAAAYPALWERLFIACQQGAFWLTRTKKICESSIFLFVNGSTRWRQGDKPASHFPHAGSYHQPKIVLFSQTRYCFDLRQHMVLRSGSSRSVAVPLNSSCGACSHAYFSEDPSVPQRCATSPRHLAHLRVNNVDPGGSLDRPTISRVPFQSPRTWSLPLT